MTAELSQKRRANVMEGGRDPANVILRQRRLKVRRTGKRSGEPGEDEKHRLPARHSSEVNINEKYNKQFNYSMDERGDLRWESLRMYLPSSSFRLDKAHTRERKMPEREKAIKDKKKNAGMVAGKSLVLTDKRNERKEKRIPRTKETKTIVEEPSDPVKRVSSEKGKIVLPPLLLLPLVKEIGDRTIKRRRLEAPAPFRRNTKAILKVRLNEKPKRKGEIQRTIVRKTNVADQENTTKETITQVTPVTVDLPNLTLRRKGIRRVKKRKKKSKEPASSSSNLARERNLLFSGQKEKINRVPSKCREGKKLRKDTRKEKKGRSKDSLKSTPKPATWQTEEGQRLLQSVRRALLAAYAMAFATTGTTPTHYRGATMMLSSA